MFIGLGTNLGNKQENLKKAVEEVKRSSEIIAVSSLYETEPYGIIDQPLFYNHVLEIKTDFSPEALLIKLQGIEYKIGRVRTVKNGPRIIDLDILFYGDMVLEKENLSIPHPRIHERAFVLIPMSEIASSFLHPVFKKTILELLSEIPKQEQEKVNFIKKISFVALQEY